MTPQSRTWVDPEDLRAEDVLPPVPRLLRFQSLLCRDLPPVGPAWFGRGGLFPQWLRSRTRHTGWVAVLGPGSLCSTRHPEWQPYVPAWEDGGSTGGMDGSPLFLCDTCLGNFTFTTSCLDVWSDWSSRSGGRPAVSSGGASMGSPVGSMYRALFASFQKERR